MIDPQHSLLVVTLNSVGHAYQIAQRIFLAGELLKLLEIVPVRNGATILTTGSLESLKDLASTIQTNEGMSSMIVEREVQTMLRAFYSLDANSMRQHMVFFEAPVAGEIFEYADRALSIGNFAILEMKIPRGGQTNGLLVLSTDDEEVLHRLPPVEGSDHSLTIIRNRAKEFSQFFPVT